MRLNHTSDRKNQRAIQCSAAKSCHIYHVCDEIWDWIKSSEFIQWSMKWSFMGVRQTATSPIPSPDINVFRVPRSKSIGMLWSPNQWWAAANSQGRLFIHVTEETFYPCSDDGGIWAIFTISTRLMITPDSRVQNLSRVAFLYSWQRSRSPSAHETLLSY
jgi:hypothetical protein